MAVEAVGGSWSILIRSRTSKGLGVSLACFAAELRLRFGRWESILKRFLFAADP